MWSIHWEYTSGIQYFDDISSNNTDETTKDVDLEVEKRSKNQGTLPFRYRDNKSKRV